MSEEHPQAGTAPDQRQSQTAKDIAETPSQSPAWSTLIIEQIEEALFSLDTDWHITYLNAHTATLIGYPQADLLNQVLWEAFPNLIGSSFEAFYRQAMTARTAAQMQDFYPSRQAWYDIRTYPIPQGLIVYLQDITTHKRAEAALRQQSDRARVQAAVSHALAAVTHDYQATLNTAAQQLAEIIGDTSAIGLVSNDAIWFEVGALQRPDPEAAAFLHAVVEEMLHPTVTSLLGRIIRAGQPVLIPVASPAALLPLINPTFQQMVERFTGHSFMAAPLRVQGRLLGSVSLIRDPQSQPYTDDDLALLQDLAERVALAITNARLFQQVQSELAERVKVEAALQVSEERFRALIENSPTAIALVNVEGMILYGSPATTQILGYALEEFVGHNMFEFIHPADHAFVTTRVAETIQTPATGVQVHARVQHKDRSWRFLEGVFTNLLANSSVGAIINNYYDVTEQKHAEEALRASEARFAGIVGSATDAIISVDEAQRILVFNAAAEQMFRCSATTVVGQPFDQFIPVASRNIHAQYMMHGVGRKGTLTAMRTGGEEFPIEVTLSHTIAAGQRLYVVIIRDITERKQIEQQLLESKERYEILSEAAYEGLVIHEHGRILETNQRLAEMFGYPHAELINMHLFQLLAPESHAGFKEQLTHDYQGSSGVWQGLRKDASQFFIESRGKPIEYQGKSVRLVAVRDVTELKQAEAVLLNTQAQLFQAEKMESVGRLAGGVAHDFNNLLTAITGYSELILADLRETDSIYADLTEIQRAAQRAAALTRQLLAFSRQQALDLQVIKLNDVVAEMNKLLHRLIGEQIELVALLDAQLALVKADPNQIEQVILNLAINARDAMPDGGQLTIETANVELEVPDHAAGPADLQTGAYVMLAISDTGVGMDQATQAKIFEPFFTTKALGKGTGLGLASVYGIVHQSQGSIQVSSEPGVGTTFKIYLPSIPDRAPTQPYVRSELATAAHTDALPPAIKLSGHGRTILVVEDEALVGALIHRVLKQAGYTTLNAQNGQEALEVLADHPGHVDMVLTDMIMPQMSGRELAERLKQQWSNLKVLGMSGYTDQAVIHPEMLQVYDAFLQKPFTPGILLRQIDTLLDAASQESRVTSQKRDVLPDA